MLYLGWAGRLVTPAMLVGGFLLGIGGTAFAGAFPFVNAWFPPSAAAWPSACSAPAWAAPRSARCTTVKLVDARRAATPFVVTAVVLAVYGVVAWLLLRDAPGRVVPTRAAVAPAWRTAGRRDLPASAPVRGRVRRLRRVRRLPARLPEDRLRPDPGDAANRMAGFDVLAVLMRPVGGWLSDRSAVPGSRRRLLSWSRSAPWCRRSPRPAPLGDDAFLVMAAVLGAGSGATFALVAQRAPANKVGSVTGVVGAAGGLGGFVPPLVMGALYGQTAPTPSAWLRWPWWHSPPWH